MGNNGEAILDVDESTVMEAQFEFVTRGQFKAIIMQL